MDSFIQRSSLIPGRRFDSSNLPIPKPAGGGGGVQSKDRGHTARSQGPRPARWLSIRGSCCLVAKQLHCLSPHFSAQQGGAVAIGYGQW